MLKTRAAAIIFCLSVFFYTHVKAQHPYFNQITTDQGLPSQTVYDIYQDKRGFIWVATENGIARYDGREFKRFTSPHLESLSVTNITEDESGNIYTNKFGGQILKVSPLDTLSLVTAFKSATFNYFGDYRFVDHYMLGCFGQNLYRYNMKTGVTEDITGMIDSVKTPFFAMINDGRKGVIFDLNFTFYYYGNNSIKKIPVNNDVQQFLIRSKAFAQIRYTTMGSVKVGNYLIQSAENGKFSNFFFEVAEDSVRPFRYAISDEFKHTEKIISVSFNKSGDKLFVNSIKGSDYYELNEKTFVFKRRFFPGILINKTMIDSEDNIWFSTLDKGVFMVPGEDIQWLLERTSDINSPRINKMSFYRDSQIAVGFHNGRVMLLNKRTGKISDELQISQLNIESMLYSKTYDELFVGAGGLYGYKPNQPLKTYSRGSYKQIIESGNGNIYTVSNFSSQAFLLNPKKPHNPFSDLPVREFNTEWSARFETIKYMRGYSLAETDDGKELWAAYKDGLKVHTADINLTISNPDTKDVFSVSSLVSVKGNSVWAGTSQSGIYIFKDRQFQKKLTTDDGLSGNEIRIMKSFRDTIWVLSDYGFDYITDAGQKIHRLSFISTVFQNEIKDFLVDSDYLYLPLGNGIIRIPYRSLPENLPSPRIYISEIKKNGISFNYHSETEFDYYERNIDISFTGINFSSGNLLKYKYRLLGLDTVWSVADYHSTKVNYISLTPGKYTFEVKAINSDGKESDESAVFQFSIDRPWWTQIWFIALSMVFIVFSLVFYIQQRENRLLELSAREQEKNRLAGELRISQLSAIKAQMNPHFIFNALNSIQNSIFRHDHETANRYLGKFSDLMRMILKMSSEESVSLEDELKALRLYLDLESIRFKDDFTYHIEVDHKIEAEWIRIPSMLIQPYVENAIKHGLLHKKTDCRLDIRLTYSEKDNVLDVEVEDNGVGRNKSEEIKIRRSKLFQSFATGANQQRLELLNYGRSLGIVCEIIDKVNESGEAAGTLVRLRIPIEEEK